MVTRLLFLGFSILLALQRMAELRLSRRNEAAIRAQGGWEAGGEHFRVMQGLHVAWFISMLLEVFLLKRLFRPWLAMGAGALFVMGQALRAAAIRELGQRWSVRVMVLPGRPVVKDGIYRSIRHPNYLGVALEILAAPLLHSAFLTASIFSLANALLLRTRIRAEEKALSQSSDYETAFAEKKKFIPRIY